jgi:hypothetical protein
MDWSVSKLIRIENANVGISTSDLRSVLALYGVTDQDEVANLVSRAKGSRARPWYSVYVSVLSLLFRDLLAYESYASCIRQIHPSLIPGLLHTESYARELLQSAFTGDQLELALKARMERQRQLRSDPPAMTFLLDEAAIRRVIGGPMVMREQLTHLLAAMDHPQTTVRVIEFSAGMHPGIAGPFVFLHLEGGTDMGVDDVVFLENANSDRFIHDDREKIAEYARDWDTAESLALSPSESATLIRGQIDILGSH